MWTRFYREAHANIMARYDLETQKRGKFSLFLSNFFGDGGERKALEISRVARAKADEATREWQDNEIRKAKEGLY
jgi:hypothetical protein